MMLYDSDGVDASLYTRSLYYSLHCKIEAMMMMVVVVVVVVVVSSRFESILKGCTFISRK